MQRVLGAIALTLALLAGPTVASAQDGAEDAANELESVANEIAEEGEDFLDVTTFTGGSREERKDVLEVSTPEPPTGPATPIPYCSPGAPICP